MGRHQRRAGVVFERSIATGLRQWLGPDWTVARNQTDRQKGQVEGCYGEFKIEGPAHFPWAIECKTHQAFDEYQLWNGTGPLSKFWEQTVAQAEAADLRPMLIFRNPRPNRRVLVALGDFDAFASPGGTNMRLVLPSGVAIRIMRWEDFLDRAPTHWFWSGRKPTPPAPKKRKRRRG